MSSTGNAGFRTLDPDAIRSLIGLIGDDRETLVEIVDAFIDEAPQRLAELRHGIDTGDGVLASRAAHTLKANARTFGAGKLALLCEEIEAAGREGDLEPALVRIDQVDDAWSEVRKELTLLREGGGADERRG